MKIVRYNGSGDWSALYIDGELVVFGDHYLSDEKISELLGVEEINSNDFMGGGNNSSDVLTSLEDIEAYQRKKDFLLEEEESTRTSLLVEAEKLEQEAQRLREKANEKN